MEAVYEAFLDEVFPELRGRDPHAADPLPVVADAEAKAEAEADAAGAPGAEEEVDAESDIDAEQIAAEMGQMAVVDNATTATVGLSGGGGWGFGVNKKFDGHMQERYTSAGPQCSMISLHLAYCLASLMPPPSPTWPHHHMTHGLMAA